MRRLLMATTVLSLACGSSELDGKHAGSSSGGNTLGGNGLDGLSCEVTSTTPVAWADATPLGTPNALFGPFNGTCRAPFNWDASGWSSLTVTPTEGQSTLTESVVVDQTSARWVTRTGGCGDMLEADATVTLTLPEGTVASAQPVTLFASGQAAPTTFTFTLKEESFGPWVSIQKGNSAATLGMSVQVAAPALGCSGSITLSHQVASNGRGEATGGPLARWTDNGCPVGQTRVDLTQPGQGLDVAAAIAADLGQVTVPGVWADGAASTLSLTTSTSATVACAEGRNGMSTVSVPVEVVASTTDGRVTRLSGNGNVRATIAQGSLSDLQLALSTDLTCSSTLDVLAYAVADCAKVNKVTAQLMVNRYRANPSANLTRVDFYLYDRPGASSGAAGKVDTFVAGP